MTTGRQQAPFCPCWCRGVQPPFMECKSHRSYVLYPSYHFDEVGGNAGPNLSPPSTDLPPVTTILGRCCANPVKSRRNRVRGGSCMQSWLRGLPLTLAPLSTSTAITTTSITTSPTTITSGRRQSSSPVVIDFEPERRAGSSRIAGRREEWEWEFVGEGEAVLEENRESPHGAPRGPGPQQGQGQVRQGGGGREGGGGAPSSYGFGMGRDHMHWA